MTNILFIFLDGVGLGSDNPDINPFAAARMPNMQDFLGGQKLIRSSAGYHGGKASLLALDACLGVPGLPQSATGQAVLLTGRNIPKELGYHYGPKPDPATGEFLSDGGIFGKVNRAGKNAALVNAYPEGYFHGIQSGRRLYSSIPLAVTNAGLPLFTSDDLNAGKAVSADFTAAGWRDRMHMPDVEVLTPENAGARLAEVAGRFDFAFFEYWLTDYAGHGQNMADAVQLLSQLDQVLGGLIDKWEDGLVLITSDHGNLEDLSTRRHTDNPVPLLLLGEKALRDVFVHVTDLTGVAPAISRVLDLD